jgi:BolA protein
MSVERLAKLRAALEHELAPVALEISDDSAAHAGHVGAREGGHFRVRLVSAAFRGRPRLERHRLVYAAVAALMHGDVHALNIVALSPEESTS